MKDPRGACHISVTIKSAPLAAESSSEEAVISDRKNRLERMMLDCSHFHYFLCAISETPRIFVCFFVCMQGVQKSLDIQGAYSVQKSNFLPV